MVGGGKKKRNGPIKNLLSLLLQKHICKRLAQEISMVHYHLQVEPNPKKKCTIKPTLFSVSMGKTGLTHDIFF